MRLQTFPAELAGYVLATAVLVVGGMFLLGPILNWICGPAIVVACVSATTTVDRARQARAARAESGKTIDAAVEGRKDGRSA